MVDQDEDILKLFISRHQQGIFALAFYLIGGDRNRARDITVSSFVKAMRSTPLPGKKDVFLTKLTKITIEECRSIKVLPFSSEPDFASLSPGEKESLRVVRIGLQLLSFDERVLILLRDQMHLAYEDIAAILGISEHKATIQTTQANSKLRKKITDVISHE